MRGMEEDKGQSSLRSDAPSAQSTDDFDGTYYAKHGMVWKRPERRRKPDGGTAISLGFPVCKMHEAVGDEAAETVAALMNAGAAALASEASARSANPPSPLPV